MPNGGVPIHMALFPKDGSPIVIYIHARKIEIHERSAWEKGESKPLCVLSDDEGSALASFLAYWNGDERMERGFHLRGVQAEFDL